MTLYLCGVSCLSVQASFPCHPCPQDTSPPQIQKWHTIFYPRWQAPQSPVASLLWCQGCLALTTELWVICSTWYTVTHFCHRRCSDIPFQRYQMSRPALWQVSYMCLSLWACHPFYHNNISLNCSDIVVWSARIIIDKYNLKFLEIYCIIYIESEREG